MASVNNVVVVGGGIAGLTLAAALRRAGIGVRIIEKGDRATRLGTGISLLGNALRALDMIGLADRCIEAGFGFDKVRVRATTPATSSPRCRWARNFRPDRPGSFGIMRPRLAEILEEAAVDRGRHDRFPDQPDAFRAG
ncbi:MAG: FAD-dependent monooxygenase [Sphingomonas fennica]